jgi:hypothetical protein
MSWDGRKNQNGRKDLTTELASQAHHNMDAQGKLTVLTESGLGIHGMGKTAQTRLSTVCCPGFVRALYKASSAANP